jgi:hypothetical protein
MSVLVTMRVPGDTQRFREIIASSGDRLIRDDPHRLDAFRALFGDERADYATALRTHYEQGPQPDWALKYVTSYASSHPWEDWAETWAHYLHMADTADTAMSFGVDATRAELASDLFEMNDLWQPEHPDAAKFLDFLNGWVRLTNVLNELSRSMGQPDYYPFVLPRAAVGKLQFVHQVITEQRHRTVSPQPAPEALFLGMCVERKGGDRAAEMLYTAQLRNRYPDSLETKSIATGVCE